MKIRIKDIARLAQVSPGTVDRVIHKRGEVSEKTRQKIETIIEELNYQPDILARTLASRKKALFSVIMPVSANGNDFWQAPNKGIDKAIEEISPFGITVQRYFFDQFNRDSFREKVDELLSEQPDAVLFAPIFPSDSVDFIRSCEKQNIRVALINSNIDEAKDAYYIGQNAMQSGYVGAKLLTYGLCSEGDILILNLAGRKDNHNHIIRRERGFRKFFAENASGNFHLHTVEMDHPSDDRLFPKLETLFRDLRVKGIFVSNSRVYRAADYIAKTGEKNIRLIGYDLLPENISHLNAGKIDFLISQKPEEQGYQGIMTLFNTHLLNREVEKIQYIPIDIITRENIEYYEYR